jgi:hypothetical protein
VADVVRRWVSTVATKGQEDAAFNVLAPRSQQIVGGRAGYNAVAGQLARQWGVWATTAGVAYDAVPIGDALALVIIHAPTKDGSETGAALPMRVIDGDWRPDPVDTTGSYRLEPEDGSHVTVLPALAADVAKGTKVVAFIDGHAATVDGAKSASADTDRVAYHPQDPLTAGWHFVALAFVHGDDVSGAVARYQVVGTK